jgi:hypothetical protein
LFARPQSTEGALLLVLGWRLWDRLSLDWRRPSLHLASLVLVASLPAALFAASLVIQQASEVAMRLEWQYEALPEAWLFSPVTYRILWRTGTPLDGCRCIQYSRDTLHLPHNTYTNPDQAQVIAPRARISYILDHDTVMSTISSSLHPPWLHQFLARRLRL